MDYDSGLFILRVIWSFFVLILYATVFYQMGKRNDLNFQVGEEGLYISVVVMFIIFSSGTIAIEYGGLEALWNMR